MRPTGAVELPLHAGGVPRWLLVRMKRVARAMLAIMMEEGAASVLVKLSDPLWFQGLSCILGFDWNSSGTTTVTCAVVKAALEDLGLGLRAAGGKGARAKRALEDIEKVGESLGLGTGKVEELKRASRLTAKVDSAAIQDGYELYHHTMLLSSDGGWAVVQQGMDVGDKTARRYHWLSMNLTSFVEEPHAGIVGDRVRTAVIDLTARSSRGCRSVCVDVACDGPSKARRLLIEARRRLKGPLDAWLTSPARVEPYPLYRLAPDSLNWEVFQRAYEARPRSFEELLLIRGVGPATVRALALIADLIYGEPPSWRDPVKFSFAFGGKDGVPRPVERELMDKVIEHLEEVLSAAELERREKLSALARLRGMVHRVK
ncbi:MAG: DUF763 domain-containing protein [Candidatus Nezhaarchaeota archaeon]|nr:DUF763 domain-containing protein [Candidatus Nezhaarchaeota archaeon]